MLFFLLINVKMSTIFGILTFMDFGILTFMTAEESSTLLVDVDELSMIFLYSQGLDCPGKIFQSTARGGLHIRT